MKKLLPLVLALVLSACTEEPPNLNVIETGFLGVNITLEVESENASGRTETVNVDDLRVEIFETSDLTTSVQSFDPFSSAPTQIELETGEYVVTASSNNLVEAGFESPYHLGTSENFTIDKEEVSSVDVTVGLANSIVVFNYSENVVNDFTSYTGQVTVVSSGTTLTFVQGETRPAHFASGEDLAVDVMLSYTKLDGSTIDRSFSTTITDPLPQTQYNINVDASLEDGQIALNVLVDNSVDEIDVDLNDSGSSNLFLDANGITVKANAEAVVGDTGEINGVTYTVVSEQQLIDMVDNGEDVTTVCTTLITNMANLFLFESTFDQDISSWDVSNVTVMGSMFRGASSFNQDISMWDVSNVRNWNSTFNNASSFNQNISSWNVSNATHMAEMFLNASAFNQDLSGWDVSSVGSCANFGTGFPLPNFTNCTP